MKRIIFLMGFCFFALFSFAQNCQTAAKQTSATCQLTPLCPLGCCNPSSCCKVAEKSASCKPVENTATEVAPTKAQTQVTRVSMLGTLGTYCYPSGGASCKKADSNTNAQKGEFAAVKKENKSSVAVQ